MRNTIRKSVVLPESAETLFKMYLDPSLHKTITGAPVDIDDEPGATFKAFEGQLTGTIIEVVKPRLIVQSWRSINFKTGDPDSTLILCFTPEENGGRIDLVHIDVPDQDYQGVNEGWEKYYFTPWRKYLENRNIGDVLK